MRSQGQAAFYYAEANNDTIVRGETQDLHFASCLLQGLGYEGPIERLWRVQADFAEACEQIDLLQCPRFPKDAQVLDYVVNAFPLPYTELNIRRDNDGGGQSGDGYKSEGNYDNVQFFRVTGFGTINPARLAYITEAHQSLRGRRHQQHDLFFTSQLPFGAFPRSGDDGRHPGGINTLFFDGHVDTLGHTALDSGWPDSLGQRLRWFTTVPDEHN